jgi:uncharacterized protein (TIGR00369 family)
MDFSLTPEDEVFHDELTAWRPGPGTAFHRMLGLRWLLPQEQPDVVTVEMDLRDDLRGPVGSLEGGVVSTLVDVAGASAAAKALAAMVATQHVAISFLAPGRNGPVKAVATPVRVGRNDAVCEVRVTDLGHDDRLVAVALVTVRALR